MKTVAYESLIASPPKFHTWDGGTTWNTGGFDGASLSRLHELVGRFDSPSIIETGAGCSTLAFLLAPATTVTSIATSAALFERIRTWLDSAGELEARQTHWDARVGRSEEVLPRLAADRPNSVDIALIDGGHGWPTVFVDFCYLNHMLRQGGILILDDLQLHSVAELGRLLHMQPGWVIDTEISGKTLAFKKTSDLGYLPDFSGQPYIKLRSSGSPAKDRLRI